MNWLRKLLGWPPRPHFLSIQFFDDKGRKNGWRDVLPEGFRIRRHDRRGYVAVSLDAFTFFPPFAGSLVNARVRATGYHDQVLAVIAADEEPAACAEGGHRSYLPVDTLRAGNDVVTLAACEFTMRVR